MWPLLVWPFRVLDRSDFVRGVQGYDNQGGTLSLPPAHGRRRAAAPPKPYTVAGTVDVGTLENSIFSWHGTLYLLKNNSSGYDIYGGRWFPEFDGHSHARVRRLNDGVVVSNISAIIGYGFISAFPDYTHNRLWLFDTNHDHSGNGPPGGYRCPGHNVTSWWAQGIELTNWGMAYTDALSTDNVEVARVDAPPSTLPAHGYVMSDEYPGFRINDARDGNLSRGWVVALESSTGPCGGPSVRWALEPAKSSRGCVCDRRGFDRATYVGYRAVYILSTAYSFYLVTSYFRRHETGGGIVSHDSAKARDVPAGPPRTAVLPPRAPAPQVPRGSSPRAAYMAVGAYCTVVQSTEAVTDTTTCYRYTVYIHSNA